jgi:hypothetical protein
VVLVGRVAAHALMLGGGKGDLADGRAALDSDARRTDGGNVASCTSRDVGGDGDGVRGVRDCRLKDGGRGQVAGEEAEGGDLALEHGRLCRRKGSKGRKAKRPMTR